MPARRTAQRHAWAAPRANTARGRADRLIVRRNKRAYSPRPIRPGTPVSMAGDENMNDTTASPVRRPVRAGAPHRKATAGLIFGAIGVVFGDIGTSPLYALQTAFGPEHGIPMNADNVMG